MKAHWYCKRCKPERHVRLEFNLKATQGAFVILKIMAECPEGHPRIVAVDD